jgi:peroxiredoxin Q/BCP
MIRRAVPWRPTNSAHWKKSSPNWTAFRDKYGLSVLLLSDPDARICKRYGVMYEKEVDGQKKMSIKRSTFVIDKHGKLRHVLYGVQAHGHAQEILNLIKDMK